MRKNRLNIEMKSLTKLRESNPNGTASLVSESHWLKDHTGCQHTARCETIQDTNKNAIMG